MLDLSGKADDERECAWIEDPALIGVPDSVKEDWRKDGAAIHLRPYAKNGELTIFKLTFLDAKRARYVQRFVISDAIVTSFWLECFALGVSIPQLTEARQDSRGGVVESMVKDAAGFRRLSDSVLNGLDSRYPGLVSFFGRLLYEAAFPSEPEKKASSPGSTGPQSSGADVTQASTAGAPIEKAEAA